MRNHRIIAVITSLFFVTLWSVSSLWSGSIDPSFESKLELLEGKEMVKAIVMMSEEVDLEALDNDLIRIKATRQERHERVVRALQAMSQRTQVDIRSFLGEAMARGEVREDQAFLGGERHRCCSDERFYLQDLRTQGCRHHLRRPGNSSR